MPCKAWRSSAWLLQEISQHLVHFCLVVADIMIKSSPFMLLAICRGQVLKREVTLADRTDITVAITEPLTGRKEVTLPVKVSCTEQVT